MPLPQLEKEMGGDDAWVNATPALKELGTLLKTEGGPFLMGKTGEAFYRSMIVTTQYLILFLTVSYADLVIVGILEFAKRIRGDLYERAVGIEPALKELYEASKPWLERDDH